jgi:hypothetical protein
MIHCWSISGGGGDDEDEEDEVVVGVEADVVVDDVVAVGVRNMDVEVLAPIGLGGVVDTGLLVDDDDDEEVVLEGVAALVDRVMIDERGGDLRAARDETLEACARARTPAIAVDVLRILLIRSTPTVSRTLEVLFSKAAIPNRQYQRQPTL